MNKDKMDKLKELLYKDHPDLMDGEPIADHDKPRTVRGRHDPRKVFLGGHTP